MGNTGRCSPLAISGSTLIVDKRMNRKRLYIIIVLMLVFISFKNSSERDLYLSNYMERLDLFKNRQTILLDLIRKSDVTSSTDLVNIKEQIELTRKDLKGMDFWFRYLD